MSDEEYELEEMGDVSEPGRANWADMAYVAVWPIRGFLEGCVNACRVFQGVMAAHSQEIMRRDEFKREAGAFIESLATSEKDK